ncbi:MAG: hypothetical protein CVT92_16400 [Bacteroidetes bacterium HGW-Bacteroidetes-1]|jgi:hypothetical protein|nr:MAG: hypothetical protein CVT92_16400 [Bacteroidetes bacterium HGW-Bacteroidetes-1]
MQMKTTIMKRWKYALALLLIMPYFYVAAQSGNLPKTFPLEENFEGEVFPPANWSVYDVDGLGFNWNASEFYNHTTDGLKSAYHGFISGLQDGWLVTPQMSLPAEETTVIALWNFTVDPFYYGKNSILISTGSGDPADNDFVELWTPVEVSDSWSQVVLSLASYAGQDVYIGFRYEGDYAHGWAIDDVYVGSDFNTDPVIAVSPMVVNANVPINGSVLKNLIISNTGVDALNYSLTYSYLGGAEGWLTVEPLSGSINGGTNLVHVLTFNPLGLELGDYQAEITIASNDPETPEVIIPVNITVLGPATVGVDVMVPAYTFPVDISENGEYVAISPFGGGGWVWSKTNGLMTITGDNHSVNAVAENGIIAGTNRNPDFNSGGINVYMAGYWHPETQEWTYLGVNPEIGEPTSSDYNSAWGMSADGSVIVGMQYLPNYQYRAFKWTQAGGYEMIGNLYNGGNRPNGISNDGSVVYGWADLPSASRSPVIWYNNEMIQIAPTQNGEAFAASSDGYYVAGAAASQGFLWDKTGNTVFFDNTLNAGGISPVAVGDDGTVFGYTAEGWPPFPDSRRAFVRTPDGQMTTFNEYAMGRGMFDANDWLFYSINGITPDGNKFIGAGITPENQTISFLIDFGAEIPSIQIMPLSLEEALEFGNQSQQMLTIQNAGNGTLEYEMTIHYQNATSKANPITVEEGSTKVDIQIDLHKSKTNGGDLSSERQRDVFTLSYDGDNIDAIGLVQGGTFYTAVRFPSELTTAFTDAIINDINVYINDIPTSSELIIWGPGTTTTPGDIIYQQAFSAAAESWNTIVLNTPLIVNGNDLWIGVEYVHDANFFVAGIDGGPVNPNGDFISQDMIAWDRLSDFGFNNNWNIRANLTLGNGTWLSLEPVEGQIPGESSAEIDVTFTANVDAGNYHANIIVTSNAPNQPLLYVPVNLEVTGEGNICYPSPRNLTDVVNGGDVVLSWQEPDLGGGGGGEDFVEDFEAGTLPTGWLSLDVDGDGYVWDNTAIEFWDMEPHTGLYCMYSASYRNFVGPLTPNNWLITPSISISSESELKFWVSAQDPAWSQEQYYVRVSTTGTAVADFTETIHSAITPIAWTEIVLDLSAYAGQSVYIAFVHADVTDMFSVKIDDVTVTNTVTKAAYTAPVAKGESNEIFFRTTGMSQSEIDARLNPQVTYVYGETAETTTIGGGGTGCPHGELLGYNVYRDGVVIGNTVASVLTFMQSNVAPGNYTYGVSAVYGQPYPGESEIVTTNVSVTAPAITTNPSELYHYFFASGDEATKQLTVGNTGNGALNWTATIEFVNGANWLGLSPVSGTVAPGGSQNMNVSFNSTGLPIGVYNANILIASNDPATPVKTVPVIMDIAVGVDENPMSAITVYPVPARSELNINLVEGVKIVRMFNFMGQVVIESSINGESTKTFSLDGLRSGAYTLQFINAEGRTFNKNIVIAM